MNSAKVSKRGANRIRQGHLWIYRSDLIEVDADAGATVVVSDEAGNFVGQALYSDKSEIALRFLTLTKETIERDWWRTRILQAVQRRRIPSDTNAYRLVSSEGDLLPSLIIDRYENVLVLQTLSQGTDRIKSLLLEIMIDEFQPSAVIERNDARVRQFEGLPLLSGTLYGSCPEQFEITQNGLRFLVSPVGGQKTGSFLDQRENHVATRVAAQNSAAQRALDCFTFNGGFALHLAGVCKEVMAIDISEDAIQTGRENSKLNDLPNVEFQVANVFDALRELESKRERFDTIVLDPPAFAKNRASLKAAIRGYKEINLRALKLLNPEGVLVTCTCSYHVSESMLLNILSEAALDAKRRVQVIEKRMQAGDHPVLVGMPETYYLKCIIARAL